jgi:hypothetical protein
MPETQCKPVPAKPRQEPRQNGRRSTSRGDNAAGCLTAEHSSNRGSAKIVPVIYAELPRSGPVSQYCVHDPEAPPVSNPAMLSRGHQPAAANGVSRPASNTAFSMFGGDAEAHAR